MLFYTRLPKMEKNYDNHYWWWFREKIILMAGRNMKCYRFWEIHLPTSIKFLKIWILFGPAIPVVGFCPTEGKASVCKAVFVVTKTSLEIMNYCYISWLVVISIRYFWVRRARHRNFQILFCKVTNDTRMYIETCLHVHFYTGSHSQGLCGRLG